MENKPEPAPENEKLVFYYSRDKRLERASEQVRRLNAEQCRGNTGVFKSLTANKSLRLLLMLVVLLSGITMIARYAITTTHEAVLEGNLVAVSAFTFEDNTYVAIKKEIKSAKFYRGPVQATIIIRGGQERTISELLLFTPEKHEEFKYKFTGKGHQVEIQLQAGPKNLILKSSVQ